LNDMTATSPSDLYYDPFDFDVDARAQEVWKRLRDEAPVYWNEKYDFYAISRYDDVLRGILDTTTFISSHGTTAEMMGPEPLALKMMIFMDPPEHTWHRKVVNRAFTPATVRRLEDRVTTLCNKLLDQVDGRREFDFLGDYGAIVPPSMILALVGFPEGYEAEWRHSVDKMLSVDGAPAERQPDQHPPSLLSGENLSSSLFNMLPDLIAERRATPKDDLMSVLVHTDLDEDGRTRKLTDEEIASFVLLLSAAGTETVARLLGWAATLLDRHADQRDELAADPELIPNAVEECLRFEAPSPVNRRWVTADIDFHGQTIRRGARVLFLNGSGNRDERHFADPDRFDVRRRIDRHLSFGYGAHFCVGAALARMEGHIALKEFLRRHPRWEVDYEQAEMIHTSTVRGYSKVPVRVG
jgi:cytochrome P450